MDPASPQPATPLESGQRIAHYQILKRIGAGGMGVVFEAEDLKLERRVALKFLPEEYTSDAHWRERFLREARAASALNHPGICTIHEINEDTGRIFLAMELLPGETLWERIRRKPLNEDEIASLGGQIADALAAAHAKGIIHRDLKPPNILITPDGRAKILDFGLAKTLDQVHEARPEDPTKASARDDTLTREGAVAGTLNYMSPEQARGEKLDARTDIFSLGATLYEMATGQAAFRGETIAVIHDAILNRQPEPVSKRNPKICAELERIIGKALEKDRELRYQTAAELRADLKRLQRDSSGTTTLPPSPSSRSKWWRVAGSAAALLLFAAYLAHLYRNQSNAPPRVAIEPVTAFTDSASVPAISPDGRAIAFLRGESEVATSSRRDVQVFFKSLPDGQPMQLTDLPLVGMNWPEFSPDGTRVAFTTLEKGYVWNVWQAPIYGGEPARMLANAEGLTWIDADHIMFSELDRVGTFHMPVVMSRLNRTEQRVVYSPSEAGMAHLSRLSPDKKWVLVVEMDSVGWLPCRLLPFDGSNAARPVGPPGAQCTGVGWSPDGAWMYFVSQAGGAFHVWRQRFPDGAPQQLTFGATQEDGISVGPDGSIYTASGIEESSIWLHYAKGERALTSEGYAFLPSMTRDKSKVYYLVRGGESRSYVSGELWSIELATSKREHLLPGIVMQHYQISADGKRVLFASGEGGDKSGLWLADLDLRHPPKQLTNGGEFRGFFGRPGEILYRESGEPKRVMRMREDSSDKRQVIDRKMWNILSVSPDGEWITFIAGRDENASTVVEALPVDGGDAVTLCDTCIAGFGPTRVGSPPVQWQGDGRALFVALKNFGIHSHQTAVFPLKNGTRPQYLVPKNLRSERDFASIPGVTLLPEENAFPGADASMYLASRRTSRSNIYRLRIIDK